MLTHALPVRDALALHGFQYSGGGAGTDYLFLSVGPWEIIVTECDAEGNCLSQAPDHWECPVIVGLYGRDGDPLAHAQYRTLREFYETLPTFN